MPNAAEKAQQFLVNWKRQGTPLSPHAFKSSKKTRKEQVHFTSDIQ